MALTPCVAFFHNSETNISEIFANTPTYTKFNFPYDRLTFLIGVAVRDNFIIDTQSSENPTTFIETTDDNHSFTA